MQMTTLILMKLSKFYKRKVKCLLFGFVLTACRLIQTSFRHSARQLGLEPWVSYPTPIGEITVDPKGVLKLLNTLNIHKAHGPDGLSARVLKECSSEIAPILTLIYDESLAQGTVPDDWRQANVAPIFKKGENMMQQKIARCRLHVSSENVTSFTFVLVSQVALTLRAITNSSEHMFKKSLGMHTGNIFPISSLLERKILIPTALEKMKR